jgi:hypothetical protein
MPTRVLARLLRAGVIGTGGISTAQRGKLQQESTGGLSTAQRGKLQQEIFPVFLKMILALQTAALFLVDSVS